MDNDSPGSDIRILVVEDNTADALLTVKALTELGANKYLHVANDGKKVLELFQTYSETQWPDLILLDLNLPKISGRQILDSLWEKKPARWPTIVILTTSREPNDAQYAKQRGAHFITKPISYTEFLHAMEKALLLVRKIPELG